MNITCFGSCDMQWDRAFIQSLSEEDNVNVLPLSNSNSKIGSHIYHLIKYKSKVIDSDLIIIGQIEEPRILNTKRIKLTHYFYNEIAKLNKKVIVIIWYFIDLYMTQEETQQRALFYENLCKHYGFNYINMHKYFTDNNLLNFYKKVDNKFNYSHPIKDMLNLFAKEILKNIAFFQFPNINATYKNNVNFKILPVESMGLKTIKRRNHLTHQFITSLDNQTIQFSNKEYKTYLIAIHFWHRAVGMSNECCGLINISGDNINYYHISPGWECISDLWSTDYIINKNLKIKSTLDKIGNQEINSENANNFNSKVGIIGFLISDIPIDLIKIPNIINNNSNYDFTIISSIFKKFKNIIETHKIITNNTLQIDYFNVINKYLAIPNVLKNISHNKKAIQSSLAPWRDENNNEKSATRALTGEIIGNEACFFTSFENNPWWMVDLEQEEFIYLILIQNRLDKHKERAKTLKIEISLDKNNWTTIPNTYLKWIALDYLVIELYNHYKARYIKLSLSEKNCLHLANIEIFTINDNFIKTLKPFKNKSLLNKIKRIFN